MEEGHGRKQIHERLHVSLIVRRTRLVPYWQDAEQGWWESTLPRVWCRCSTTELPASLTGGLEAVVFCVGVYKRNSVEAARSAEMARNCSEFIQQSIPRGLLTPPPENIRSNHRQRLQGGRNLEEQEARGADVPGTQTSLVYTQGLAKPVGDSTGNQTIVKRPQSTCQGFAKMKTQPAPATLLVSQHKYRVASGTESHFL